MRGRQRLSFLVLTLASVVLLDAAPADLDAAFVRFWRAHDPSSAARARSDIVKSGASFDEVYARLQRGRPYAGDVPTGLVQGRRRGAAGEFAYTLEVPATYQAGRAYQVRIQLHGGVNRPASAPRRPAGIGRLAGAEQIYILPQAWDTAPWWSDAQLENLRAILDTVERTYNVDENRVVLSGVSDGGTGAYYVAMRDPTPYAAFLPLNGSLFVLRNDSIGVDGDLFPTNLSNRPFFVVNGGRDPLYPTASVEPILDHLQRGGVPLVYHPQPDAGHETSWWPREQEAFETFVREHPRVPLPDRFTWESSRTQTWGRFHWLVLDAFGSRSSDTAGWRDLNIFPALRAVEGPTTTVFRHHDRAGRVDVERRGNRVEALTRGVSEFTLLLSPAQFELARPVIVTTNGNVAFEGVVDKSVATLLKWSARDNDRTMLFGAELRIRVK